MSSEPAEQPTVFVEALADGVALVRIDRAERRNALNLAMRAALAEAFEQLGRDDNVRVIVLTGTGKAFMAGTDLNDMVDQSAIEILKRRSHLYWAAIAACPKPVIAAVNGYAYGGGCELAMHADIILAARSASFGQLEVKVGIMPGAGGTQRLVRAVGKYRAMHILMTGRVFDAAEAERIGLVSELVDDDALMARATELATEIAALPPLALAEIKEAVVLGADMPLSAALALERKSFQLLFSSADQKEGMRAFLDRRPAKFEGR